MLRHCLGAQVVLSGIFNVEILQDFPGRSVEALMRSCKMRIFTNRRFGHLYGHFTDCDHNFQVGFRSFKLSLRVLYYVNKASIFSN